MTCGYTVSTFSVDAKILGCQLLSWVTHQLFSLIKVKKKYFHDNSPEAKVALWNCFQRTFQNPRTPHLLWKMTNKGNKSLHLKSFNCKMFTLEKWLKEFTNYQNSWEVIFFKSTNLLIDNLWQLYYHANAIQCQNDGPEIDK